jgi:pimeloyl-ACP methyl ester carboxylesterase
VSPDVRGGLSLGRRLWRIVAASIAVIGSPGVVVAAVFVVAAVTGRGIAAGVAGLCIAAACWRSAFSRSRRHDVVAAAFFAGAVVIVAALLALAPRAASRSASLRSVWSTEPPTSSPFWFVPEVDQVCAGLVVAAFVDPFITVTDAVRIRGDVARVYADVDRDLGQDAVGSAIPAMVGGPRSWHRFEVWPHDGSPPRKALVFLHGSGANFLAYAWLFQALADEFKMLVILPSFGAGNWHNDGGVDVIESARDVARAAGVAQDAILVGGLSNGGRGVTRAFRAHPDHWAGLIFLSAVVEEDVIGDAAGCSAAGTKPVLFVHGGRDNRVATDGAAAAVARYAAAGCAVTSIVDDDEDHFWWFHHPAAVGAALRVFFAAQP